MHGPLPATRAAFAEKQPCVGPAPGARVAMTRLTVTGAASAQMLLRLVNLLAQRGLMPRTLHAETSADRLVVAVDLDLPPAAADTLVNKLLSLVEVADVRLEETA